ncbi:MAG: AAA family ATPase [Actinomycetota bacterium]|nr:AAA family ATPase [Actinomycetota bacterium]
MEAAPLERELAVVRRVGTEIGANIRRALQVRDEVVELMLIALLARGHVLIEDVPGVGKTALARALARSIRADFSRIQCTADLLPADVVGSMIFNQREARFEFHSGPVFANIVLVDEINRASPKTQSGLLEAMQERGVTVEGETHELAQPFLIVATQNPVEFAGTYPLPEAQLDRFMARVELGYPDAAAEASMLSAHAAGDVVAELEPVVELEQVVAAQAAASSVHGSAALRRYVVALAAATRADPRVELGASPRAALMLYQAGLARAALRGQDHVLPDDVQALAGPVLRHRLLLGPGSNDGERATVVTDAIDSVPAL